MAKVGFLFPGQGAQYVGMGRDLYESYPEAKDLWNQAEDILGFPLKKICFEGPEDALKQTCYTQPAIFVHSIVVDQLLKSKGIQLTASAGHSLGEYSALVSAGVLTFEDGLKLVKIRGELMQKSGEKHPGTMAAIMGLTPEVVKDVCREAGEFGIVQAANFNCPGQIVISGSIPGVTSAMEIAGKKGARMVKQLVVSGAFHSPLMGDALEGLIAALEKVELKTTHIPVYSNVEAAPVTEPKKIRELLRKQLLAPVLWENIVHNMAADGYETFWEVGPGKILKGLLKRTRRTLVCQTVGTVDELNGFSG